MAFNTGWAAACSAGWTGAHRVGTDKADVSSSLLFLSLLQIDPPTSSALDPTGLDLDSDDTAISSSPASTTCSSSSAISVAAPLHSVRIPALHQVSSPTDWLPFPLTATSSPADLSNQISSRFKLDPSSTRLSYGSRTISSSSSASFDDLAIPNHATIDLSLRLLGGGPKKRCAYVFAAKPAASASAPVASTSATPAEAGASESVASTSIEAQEGEQKKEEVPAAVVSEVQEPVMERCGSAALVSWLGCLLISLTTS